MYVMTISLHLMLILYFSTALGPFFKKFNLDQQQKRWVIKLQNKLRCLSQQRDRFDRKKAQPFFVSSRARYVFVQDAVAVEDPSNTVVGSTIYQMNEKVCGIFVKKGEVLTVDFFDFLLKYVDGFVGVQNIVYGLSETWTFLEFTQQVQILINSSCFFFGILYFFSQVKPFFLFGFRFFYVALVCLSSETRRPFVILLFVVVCRCI